MVTSRQVVIRRLSAPIGMIVLDEDNHIEWMNQFMTDHIETNVISENVNEVFLTS